MAQGSFEIQIDVSVPWWGRAVSYCLAKIGTTFVHMAVWVATASAKIAVVTGGKRG